MTEAPSSEKKPTGTQKPATPVFRPGSAAAGLKPAEIKPLLTSEQTRSEPVAQGIDLADRPKIILTAGRGKTGKTTFLRWIVEMATMENKAPLLADRSNQCNLLDFFRGCFQTRYIQPDRCPRLAARLHGICHQGKAIRRHRSRGWRHNPAHHSRRNARLRCND